MTDVNRRDFLARAGAVVSTSGLALMSAPRVIAATDDEVSRYAVKADDIPPEQQRLMVSGKPAAIAVARFQLYRSDINFNGRGPTSRWFDVETKHGGGDAMLQSWIGRAISSDEAMCEIKIEGVCAAREVASFINAIQANKGVDEVPSKRTFVVLMKEWGQD